METSFKEIKPHPLFLEALFAFKAEVSTVFNDVLGLYEINHIAVTQISAARQILTFSSTPAIEFNLFNSNLWRFDKTYHSDWFTTCTRRDWQSLYSRVRYDELYYLKQSKPKYPLGYSFSVKQGSSFLIYSLASHRSCNHTRELFANQFDNFHRIGQYCTKTLRNLFMECDSQITAA